MYRNGRETRTEGKAAREHSAAAEGMYIEGKSEREKREKPRRGTGGGLAERRRRGRGHRRQGRGPPRKGAGPFQPKPGKSDKYRDWATFLLEKRPARC